MHRSHQTRSYPTDKMIPPSVLTGRSPVQRKLEKRTHIKRMRQHGKEKEQTDGEGPVRNRKM